MTTNTAPQPRFTQEPPDRFYWATLSASDLGLGIDEDPNRIDRDSLHEAIDRALLPDLDTLDFALARIGGNQIIACLQDQQIVRGRFTAGDLHYGPASLPPPLDADPDASTASTELNFLHGALSPAPLIASRRRRAISTAIATGVLALMAILGIEVRRSASIAHEAAAADATATLLSTHRAASLEHLNRQADRLAAMHIKLDGLPGHASDRQDAGAALAALLAAWPRDGASPFALTESLSSTADSVTLQFLAPTRDDATRLATSLTSFPAVGLPDGKSSSIWSLAQPQITTIAPGTGSSIAASSPVNGAAPSIARASFRFARGPAAPPPVPAPSKVATETPQ
jgi:hypothetical protein